MVKWLGVAYLVFVGARTLLSKPWAIDTEVITTSLRRSYSQEIIIDFLNLKVVFFRVVCLPIH